MIYFFFLPFFVSHIEKVLIILGLLLIVLLCLFPYFSFSQKIPFCICFYIV